MPNAVFQYFDRCFFAFCARDLIVSRLDSAHKTASGCMFPKFRIAIFISTKNTTPKNVVPNGKKRSSPSILELEILFLRQKMRLETGYNVTARDS